MTKPSFRVAPQMHAIDVPEGVTPAYANMVRIAHMPTEIVLDYGDFALGGELSGLEALPHPAC